MYTLLSIIHVATCRGCVMSCAIYTHTPARRSSTNFQQYYFVIQICSTNWLGHGHGYKWHSSCEPFCENPVCPDPVFNVTMITIITTSMFTIIHISITITFTIRIIVTSLITISRLALLRISNCYLQAGEGLKPPREAICITISIITISNRNIPLN